MSVPQEKILCLETRLGPGVKIVKFDDNGLIALDKPPGIVSHPNGKSIEETALLKAYYDQKLKKYSLGNSLDFFLLNRLDSPTSGVIIGCFDQALAEAVIHSFALNSVEKKYIALTKFTPCPNRGRWEECFQKTLINNRLRLRKAPGEKCITCYKILKIIDFRGTALALLELRPITGKTHQLRAQCAFHNLAIIGDKTYGDFGLNKQLNKSNLSRMFLHSESLKIAYNLHGKAYKFLAISTCNFKIL
ncbi:MAG: RNA pseudouridine synthase [Puniceicoccales bacterium]|jgi:23S rRNA-/tRNA-specific pseudouridylate synthase|nr:RNA pseudouridine synthase [Puniceicoccales bacterium]